VQRFRLFDILDQNITQDRIASFRHPRLYPSEASVVDIDGTTHGRCLRAVYYRLTNTEKTNPENARAMWIFQMGNIVEAAIIEQCKQAGIWYADHIKWFNPRYNISGELDFVIRHPQEPDMLIGCEVKSFYGYQASSQIMGTRTRPGFPKMDQLLQAFLYVDWFKEILSGFKMVYMDRGGADRRDFNIQFIEADEDGTRVVYPVVDNQVFHGFTLNGIYDRFEKAWALYQAQELPDRDYRLYYSPEEMEQRIANNLVSKTDTKGFQRYPFRLKYRKADWQCRYCNWTNLCWNTPSLSNEEVSDLGLGIVEEAEDTSEQSDA
jgi:hypothetical protein